MLRARRNIQFLLYTQILIATANAIIPIHICSNVSQFHGESDINLSPTFFSNEIRKESIASRPINNGCEEFFDFVVVGSGSAGSVIANRLSENPDWNVLLLEAGEVPTNLTDIVAMAVSFQGTDYNWAYVMEPQEHAGLGLVDGIMNWPRGKVLGGTTTINACVHVRGNRINYDRWAEAGNYGWSFEDVLPYFKKSEDFLVKFQDPEYHRQGGLLGVQDVPFRSNSSKAFVRSMLDYGYEYVDYNGREQIGVSFVHGTLRNGRRSGGFNAFLEPFQYRENLKIYTGARATKVLIDEEFAVAYGVQYDINGETRIAKVQKEVILSAGSFASPQLLMLSGIGPRQHLEDLDIPVIKDLPVGKNLADQIVLYGLTFTVNESITIPYDQIETNPQVMEDFYNGEGILTTLTGTEALAFVKTPYSPDPELTLPDIEMIYIGTSSNKDNGAAFKQATRIKDEIYEAIWGQIQNQTACTIVPMLLHPKSRGHLELQSADPYHAPKFYGNYLSDPNNDDVKVLISSVRMVKEIVRMPSWERYDARLVEPVIPGCDHILYDTDDYWECFIRHLGITSNHQVGTCKMGPISDPEAVVGADLRVHGVAGLRIADTSIMPELVAGHTSIPTFMIGEKAADMIKETWSKFY